MPDPVAYYAAAVGTASLGWQVLTYVQGHRTRLEVRVGAGFAGEPALEWQRLYTTVVNHSRHDVPTPGVTIYQPAIGRAWPIHAQDIEEGMPPAIPARGSLLMTVPVARFVGMRLPDPVVATAMTTTGESFSSGLSALCAPPSGPTVVAGPLST